jgi:hypothetical protein
MSNINRLNSSDTLLDLDKPLPPRTKCASGSDWFYTDIQYAKFKGPGSNSGTLISECSTLSNIEFNHSDTHIISNGIVLPNKTISDVCMASKYGDLYYMINNAKSNGQIQPDEITSLYSMPTGCPLPIPPQPEPLCNSNNQLYDSQFQVCVSCRDTTVKPTIVSSSQSDSNYVDNSVKPNTNYQCKNNPFVLSDLSGKAISQSCNSSETLTNGKCVITFNANQN